VKTKASILALIAELDKDLAELMQLQTLNFQAWSRVQLGSGAARDWEALGLSLYTLYGVLERYFLRISHFFERELPSDRWHKALVENLCAESPPPWPALLTDEGMKVTVLDWLRFCRKVEAFGVASLGPGRTGAVQRQAWAFLESFPSTHAAFVARILRMAEGLS